MNEIPDVNELFRAYEKRIFAAWDGISSLPDIRQIFTAGFEAGICVMQGKQSPLTSDDLVRAYELNRDFRKNPLDATS